MSPPPGAEGDPSAKRALAAPPHRNIATHRKPTQPTENQRNPPKTNATRFALQTPSATRAPHRSQTTPGREPKATQARSAHSQRRRIATSQSTENQRNPIRIANPKCNASAASLANNAGPGAEGDPSAKRALAAARIATHRKPTQTRFDIANPIRHRKPQVQSERRIARKQRREPKVIPLLNPVHLILQETNHMLFL
jgi:hypothetical protein